jgi:catechol O-methyltransferase
LLPTVKICIRYSTTFINALHVALPAVGLTEDDSSITILLEVMFGDDEEEDVAVGCLIRPKTCGVMSFHNGTEEALFAFIYREMMKDKKTEGSSRAMRVLEAVDTFCYSRHWMMHIGDQKGQILLDAVRGLPTENIRSGKIIIELGSYCGYSTVLMSTALESRDLIISIEINKKCVEYTRRLLDVADITCRCIVLEGNVENKLDEIVKLLQLFDKEKADMIFIDHDKTQYCKDLIFLEGHGLLGTGTVVCADNVLSFGVPIQDYLDYVRSSGLYSSSVCHLSTIEYPDAETSDDLSVVDGLELSIHI